MKKDKLKIAIGVLIGGIFGFLLYRFIGCKTGYCPLTRNPWTSIIYGMLLGLLLTLR